MAARDVLTKNQLCVLEKLETASGPLSAYTLLDQLRERGFRAPLQVYRALDTLVKSGFVHRLESINSFVACAEPHAWPPVLAAQAQRCAGLAQLCAWSKRHTSRSFADALPGPAQPGARTEPSFAKPLIAKPRRFGALLHAAG